jgi:hypothetical protein
VETLPEALWRRAVFRTRGHSPISDLVAQFDLGAYAAASAAHSLSVAGQPQAARGE